MYSWKRGTPLKDAKIVFDKAEQADIAGNQYAYHDRDGICHEFQSRSVSDDECRSDFSYSTASSSLYFRHSISHIISFLRTI